MRSRNWNRLELEDCSTYTSFRPMAMLAICRLRMPEVSLPSPLADSSSMSSICSKTLIGKPAERISINWACSSACIFAALTQTR